MATLLCRYLMDEGSGTTFADSSGNGYDLTITTGGGSAWTTLDSGTGWYNGSRSSGSKAQSETAHLAFDGLAQVTAVMVLQSVEGNSGMPRTWFIGSSGGNGIISTNVGVNLYEGRWMREPDDDNHIRNQYPAAPGGGYTQYHVLIMEYDPLLDGSPALKIKAWINGTELTFSGGNSSSPYTALDVRSTDRFCLFNRPAQNNGAKGKYGYFEAWDGLLTAQEKTDATAALLLDCDSPWDGGGPPTSVSFTSEPSATNIDTDRVTANATAESDAP